MKGKAFCRMVRQFALNAFCATGTGGGVDPSCGKEGGGKGGGKGGGERQRTAERRSDRPGEYQVKTGDGSYRMLRVGDVSPLTASHLGSRVGGTHKGNLFHPETGEHVGTATRLIGGRWVQDKGQVGRKDGKSR